jgi:hypothetical protein
MGPDRVTVRTEGQNKNPIYKKLLLEIDKREASLLGLDQPHKVDVRKDTRQVVLVEHVVNSRADVAAARAAGLIK